MTFKVWLAAEGEVFNLKGRGVFSTVEKAQAHLEKRADIVFPGEPVVWQELENGRNFRAYFGTSNGYVIDVLRVPIDFYVDNFLGTKKSDEW